MAFTQANRRFSVTTPVGADVLILKRLVGTEHLSRLFEFELELHSEDIDVKHEDMLGESVTINIELPDGEMRYINGLVSRFSMDGYDGHHVTYRATVSPWLWLLTRTADCRIFQEMTVPDIIKQVFRDHGFSDYEERITGAYRSWEYCVQYRETDFNFVSRLMEQEGIYFFFSHDDGKHTLVLADGSSAHNTVPNYETVPYFPPDTHERRDRDHLSSWNLTKQIQPGSYALTDYDFKAPKKNLAAVSEVPREHSASEFEIFDYPGEYLESSDGDAYVKARIQELQAQHEILQGEGDAAGLITGAVFELTDYPRSDQNRKYLIIGASYDLSSSGLEVGGSAEQESLRINIQAIDVEQPFRAARTTPKPMVQGVQTAIVVGPKGEEIHTDEYGRVKVQFHWDRYGETNENSSCWIRVAHIWAGKNWGGVYTPRIGQEVIVDFIEGDPDQPIITGRVYNKDNMPPYELPANKTQSGIKTRSSKGGDSATFNEIRFEDKKGSEELYVHAEKDQNNVVENDQSTSVGHDQANTIGNDRKKDVGNNETTSIGVNRTETVGADETVSIGGSRSVTIGSSKTETVAINKAETIGIAKELTIGGLYQVTVGGLMNETVALAKAQEVLASKTTAVVGKVNEKYSSSQSTDVGSDKTIKVGKNLKIDVADQITITTGKASIMMKKDGTITISGENITLNGKGEIKINADKDMSLKGKSEIKIKANKNITMKGNKILQN